LQIGLLVVSFGLVSNETLVLIDLENVCGLPQLTPHIAIRAAEELARTLGPDLGGCMAVAAGVSNERAAKRAARRLGAQCLLGRGVDGADRALLGIGWSWLKASTSRVPEHSPRLVLCTGDHAFCDLAYAVRSAGGDVIVCARRRCLSKRLRANCTGAVILAPE
jgi:hypothetical protein